MCNSLGPKQTGHPFLLPYDCSEASRGQWNCTLHDTPLPQSYTYIHAYTYIHTHTHKYIYIYIYGCICICFYLSVMVLSTLLLVVLYGWRSGAAIRDETERASLSVSTGTMAVIEPFRASCACQLFRGFFSPA